MVVGHRDRTARGAHGGAQAGRAEQAGQVVGQLLGVPRCEQVTVLAGPYQMGRRISWAARSCLRIRLSICSMRSSDSSVLWPTAVCSSPSRGAETEPTRSPVVHFRAKRTKWKTIFPTKNPWPASSRARR